MAELNEKIEKMEKDIKSLIANLKGLKEELKNNNTVLKDKFFSVLESKMDEKFDILNEKQIKDVDEKMSTITQNIT